MNIPKECFLTKDKNGIKLKVGDILISNSIPLWGVKPKKKYLKPIEDYQGQLIIPYYGNFLLKYYVETYCEIDLKNSEENVVIKKKSTYNF
jgi:hypothetical protein